MITSVLWCCVCVFDSVGWVAERAYGT